ncbi:MAG: peptidoglycan-associated lipoprotein, partial [Candidatus Aminicenantes bacterium]|nr:peptidoglycan-associated lipoprotein [Candidatus Aminicenantes bacterium]
MKKTIVFSLAFLLIFGFFISCKKKVEETPPPPPPQVKEQPKVEKVEAPVVVKEPELTEEDIFMQKSLEELNRESNLRMIHFDYDKYFIREDAKPILEANAAYLK